VANKNFTVKNGLEVGGQEVISSSGAITSAALGGQVLGTSASPSFANITTAGYLRGPASFVIDPAAHGDDTGTVVIAGNLQVDGTQTTINSTTMTVDDLNLTLASGAANAAAANGAGINVDISGATNPSLVYGSSNDDWTFNKSLNVSGTLNITQASTADTIKLTRSTTSHNNMIKFRSGGADKWIVGQRNDSTDHFRFYSYGTSSDVLSIKTDGNVGIGTTVPYAKLSVKDGTNINLGIKVGQTDGNAVMLNAYNDAVTANIPMEFRASKFNFENGNVGIGTTSPVAKLHIQGAGTYNHTPGQNTTSDFVITSSEMADNNAHSIMQLVSVRQSLSTGSGATGYLGFSTVDDSNGQGIRDAGRIAIVNETGTSRNSATALSFWTNAGGTDTTAAVEKMRITSAGKVGIGTSTPHGMLQFDSSVNTRKIVLYEGADNDYQFYGFGVEGSTLVYSTYLNSDDHVFFSGASSTSRNELMRIEGNGNVGIGTSSMSSSYGKLTVAGTGISITPDTAAKMQIGRYNAANPYSYIKAGSTSSGFKFTNAADSVDLLTIDSSGMSVGLVTTNDIKATGAGGISIQTDEGTKRIEVFDNGKVTFNNLLYQSGINKNTINSGYDNNADDSDIWINYRGYNDGHTRTRDFRIGDGKGNAMAFFDGSEMTANIHTLRVNTGSFRAVGTLPSSAGMALTGVGLGQLSNYAHAQFSGSAGGYIDFAEPNVDWSGRIIYTHSDDSMVFYSNAQPTMFLTQTGATVRNGPNANQGKLTFSTQSTAYNIMGGNYWGYTGINSGGHIRLGSNNGEQMRLGAGVSTGNMALGLIGVSGVNSQAVIHGKSTDATLVVTNTDLSGASTWGWTGRGGRVLTSNGTNWTNDGKDAALVIGSNIGTTQRGGGLGIVLHNESNVNSNFSPGLYFSTKSESSGYNTAYGYIMGRKMGSGVDTNWSTGEIHMDTAGSRTGTTSRNAYMDDSPAFKMDSSGDINMPYKAYAYGTIAGNPSGPTNNYGLPLTTTRYQNCTPQTNSGHGPGITITKAGFYILNMSLLYDPIDYVYLGWCVNGTQIHHWHSNHAVASNHDAVSQIGRFLNIGDHVSIENSNRTISTIYGNSHSAWYIAKIG